MRGHGNPQASMFSYISLEERVPQAHPIRKIRRVVDKALKVLEPEFAGLYAQNGRPSIPPEHLLRALLLQILYSIRSERQLVERIDYDLLFRWFVGLSIDDPVWNHSTFTKNRDRLLSPEIARRLFEQVRRQAYAKQLLSRDHFSIDGTLIDASASMKSFVPRDTPTPDKDDCPGAGGRNKDVDFRGEKRSNKTHASRTDPDAQLYRKGQAQSSRLCMMGHITIENRNGLIVETELTQANGYAEREAGLSMLDRLSKRPKRTVGADKGYDTKDFVASCRERGITPHVAAKHKYPAIDKRTTGTPGYTISQRIRKRVEEPFGWMKTVGTLRKLKHRGTVKATTTLLMNATMFNVVRMEALL